MHLSFVFTIHSNFWHIPAIMCHCDSWQTRIYFFSRSVASFAYFRISLLFLQLSFVFTICFNVGYIPANHVSMWQLTTTNLISCLFIFIISVLFCSFLLFLHFFPIFDTFPRSCIIVTADNREFYFLSYSDIYLVIIFLHFLYNSCLFLQINF